MTTEAPPDRKEEFKKLKDRITYLESVVAVVLDALKDAEIELGEPLVKTGEYFGIKFD